MPFGINFQFNSGQEGVFTAANFRHFIAKDFSRELTLGRNGWQFSATFEKELSKERIDSLTMIKVTTLVTVMKEREKSIIFRRKILGYFEFTFLIML